MTEDDPPVTEEQLQALRVAVRAAVALYTAAHQGNEELLEYLAKDLVDNGDPVAVLMWMADRDATIYEQIAGVSSRQSGITISWDDWIGEIAREAARDLDDDSGPHPEG